MARDRGRNPEPYKPQMEREKIVMGHNGQNRQMTIVTAQDTMDTPKGVCPFCPVEAERVSLYLERLQAAEIAPLLRHATLNGLSLIADCTRSHRGVRVTLGLITRKQALKSKRYSTPKQHEHDRRNSSS